PAASPAGSAARSSRSLTATAAASSSRCRGRSGRSGAVQAGAAKLCPMPSPATASSAPRRNVRRWWPAVAALALAAAAAGLVAALLERADDRASVARTVQTPPTVGAPAPPRRSPPRPVRLVERRLASLDAPVQDAAAVALDGRRALLLGGLTASDTSTAAIAVAGT